ncbi:hypothetical protein ACFYZE_19375 [Streptomyces sp. NPDC001796]|uniref:hypothetical protein n=1 Tax=Streptomyces sp. NPDC001796 TaxID=3364609 RepID=UPI00368E341C
MAGRRGHRHPVAVTTALNVRGIRTAERVNDPLMVFQMLVTGIFVALRCATSSTRAAPVHW